MEENRDFKGVWIPKQIWLDDRLNALDKVILAEVDSLDNGERGCFASNRHIAEFCQCSETKVSTAISKLIKLGYLSSVSFDGRQRILKSSLSNFERQPFKNCKADLQNLKHSNIENNTDNNTDRERRFTPPTVEEVKAYCEERKNKIDPESFVAYYARQGWKLSNGKKMVDWKSAVITWEKREKKGNQSGGWKPAGDWQQSQDSDLMF